MPTVRTLAAWLPRGRVLAPAEFEPRQRGIVVLALVQAAGLALLGWWMDWDLLHSIGEAAVPAGLALVALAPSLSHRTRSVLACLALVVESAILVHVSGGYIEAHFHFFAMLAVVALYQDYAPFLVAVGFVAIGHGVIGAIAPAAVYNHPAAIAAPWTFALIHAAFVLAESAALLVTWKVIETAEEGHALAQARLDLERDMGIQREMLARNERLASLGTLVAGVAHEINNPLTYVSGNLELAIDELERPEPDPEEARRRLVTAMQGTLRITAITTALRAVARAAPPEQREGVDIAALIREVETLVATSIPQNVELAVSAPSGPARVRANASQIHQAVLNLVQNAVQAVTPEGGRVELACRRDGASVVVEVADDGPGIPEHVRAKLFTPFFTTKPNGTGLGLSIVHSIVQAHGGEMCLTSTPGAGARFRFALPASAQG